MSTGAPIRIAIVDDHRMLLTALVEWIRAADAGIEVAAAVPSWSELLAHPQFPVDVVLLDLDLRDDLDILMKLRFLRTAGTKTIVISTHSHRPVIAAALDGGASAYLLKSEKTETIIDAIRAAADGREFSTAYLRSILNGVGGPSLSERERSIVSLYGDGRPVKQVAFTLGISEETVRSYLRRIRIKYRMAGIEIGSKLALHSRAIEEGLIERSP